MASIGSDGSRHISHQNICFVAKGGFLKRPGSVYPRLSALNTLCGLSVFREHGSSHSAADFFKHCRVIRISSAIANKTNHWITLRFNDLARRIDSSWQISKQTIELIRTKSSGMIERGYEYWRWIQGALNMLKLLRYLFNSDKLTEPLVEVDQITKLFHIFSLCISIGFYLFSKTVTVPNLAAVLNFISTYPFRFTPPCTTITLRHTQS